jgi:type IV pilus assembly protein PilW
MLVTMAISSVLIAALYQVFQAQQRSYVMQDEVAEMQQSLRAGMYLMNRELRSAGYDPTRDAGAGFVTTLLAPHNTFEVDYEKRDAIAFTTDSDLSGGIDDDQQEQIAYRLNAGTLERFVIPNPPGGPGQWQAVVPNVDALDFLYLDRDGNPTTDPAAIRTIEVSLLVRMGKPDHKFVNTTVYQNKQGETLCPVVCAGDHYHRSLLTTTVQVRNLARRPNPAS